MRVIAKSSFSAFWIRMEKSHFLFQVRNGKHNSLETRRKISKNHADFSGEKHPRWKGGQKLRDVRKHAKRRHLPIPNVFLNSQFPEAELHHTGIWVSEDRYLGIWVPANLQDQFHHDERTENGLAEMNFAAIRWLLKL